MEVMKKMIKKMIQLNSSSNLIGWSSRGHLVKPITKLNLVPLMEHLCATMGFSDTAMA